MPMLNWQLDFQDARFRFRIGLQRSINSILSCIHDRLNMPGLRAPSGHGTSTEIGIDVRFARAFDTRSFGELNLQQLTGANWRPAERDYSTRNIDTPLTPQRVQFSLLTLVVYRFSLISRCTHRAHAAF
jgi:hypothetical protein